ALDWASAVWDADPQIRTSFTYFAGMIREAIKFRTLATQSGWNDAALWAVFRKGLSPVLQTELACREDATSLSQYVATAIRLDNLLRQHRAGARPPVSSRPRLHPDYPRPCEEAPEPMQLGRSRLTEREHQRRAQMRLCYYCGGSGHLIHRCPEKPSSTQVGEISLFFSLTVPVSFCFSDRCVFVPALMDSGAAVNLIDRALVGELRIPSIPCMPSLRITAIDSQPIGGGYLTIRPSCWIFKWGCFIGNIWRSMLPPHPPTLLSWAFRGFGSMIPKCPGTRGSWSGGLLRV
ncbi:hypothetical protein QTP70_026953, partial [Hemibagrus guttatus]